MTTITFEFHGQLLRLAGAATQAVSVPSPATLAAALDALAVARPELAAALARCACAIGEHLILRRDALHGGETVALLPPVAGG